MLFLLFQHKRVHSVVLDGKEIGTTIGYKHSSDYTSITYCKWPNVRSDRVKVRVQLLDLLYRYERARRT